MTLPTIISLVLIFIFIADICVNFWANAQKRSKEKELKEKINKEFYTLSESINNKIEQKPIVPIQKDSTIDIFLSLDAALEDIVKKYVQKINAPTPVYTEENKKHDFINVLKLSRDRFASSAPQKKAVEQIIANVEKFYGKKK